jgi:hypothetical protein
LRLSSPRYIDAAKIRQPVGFATAAAAIEEALRNGLDPDATIDRSAMPIPESGEIVIIESASDPGEDAEDERSAGAQRA